jgi:hypothetical protein
MPASPRSVIPLDQQRICRTEKAPAAGFLIDEGPWGPPAGLVHTCIVVCHEVAHGAAAGIPALAYRLR